MLPSFPTLLTRLTRCSRRSGWKLRCSFEQVEPYSPYAVFEEDEDYEVDTATGKPGRWYNPNARWDWYCVGGRWRGQLKLLEGKTGRYGSDCTSDEQEMLPNLQRSFQPRRCDSARVQDCDFSQDQEAYKKAVQFYFPGAEVRMQLTIDLIGKAAGKDSSASLHSAQNDSEAAAVEAAPSLVLNLADYF